MHAGNPGIQIVAKLYNIYIMLSHTCAHNAPKHLFYGNWIDFPNLVLLMRLTLNKKKKPKTKRQNRKINIRRKLLFKTFHQMY